MCMDFPVAVSSSPNVVQAVAEYGRQLFRFIRGRVRSTEEAEDILQEVWYQFALLPDVEELESASGWLYKVARNKIIDNFRKKRPEPLPEDADHLLTSLLADDGSPEAELFRAAFWEELQTALAEMPPAQAHVFVENELEGKTLQQIADESGAPLKTIISRKGYAVKHLRTRLANLYQDLSL